MADNVVTDVTINGGAVLYLARSPEMQHLLEQIADAVAQDVRDHAPVKTGAGKDSIEGDAILVDEGWIAAISWDRKHFYMGIQNKRKPFAEPALQRVRFV